MGAQDFVAQLAGSCFQLKHWQQHCLFQAYPTMGAACSSDHEMMGEWSIESDLDWSGTLHILEGTEEHFEGDLTGVLKNFKAKGGKWSAIVAFDDVGDEKDTFTLSGTYEDDSAECDITPGKDNVNTDPAKWTLKKIGEAHE